MTSGFTFGSAATQKTPGLTFGTTNTGLGFGTASQPAQSTGLTFGSPAPTGFSFGAPGAQSTGLSFGTSATSTPQTGLTFGTPTASTAQTGLSFGTPAASTPQTGLTFGTPAASTPQTGLSFSTPAASTAQTSLPSFGASSAFGQPALTFGTPASSAPSGLTFGTPVATVTPSSAATTGQSTLGFGTGGLNFGGHSTTCGGGFSIPAISTGTFGSSLAPTSTSVTSGFQGLTGLGTSKPGGLFSTPTATSATPLSFSTSLAAPSTSLSTGFTLGGTGTSGGLFGLGGKSFLGATSATTAATTTTTPSLGLGGVDTSQSKTGPPGSISGRTDKKAVKENQIPNEIVQTIDSFKTFVKAQKNLSSDIARGSVKPLHKVQEDTELLKQLLSTISSGLQKNITLAIRLKVDTAKCLHNAEMAQRTHDTPPGLQYDNTAPLQYFQELVAGFEHEMQLISQQIENTEKHIRSIMQPVPLTSQELSLVMRRLHDSFVALAGRLQSVHNSVENQKEQYLNLRKYFLKDSTNVFLEGAKKSTLSASKPSTMVKMSAGPTPFSALGSQHGFGLLSSNSPGSKTTFSSGNPLGWGSGQVQQQQQHTQFLSNLNNPLFTGATSTVNSLATPQPVENQGFQLQKPPVGNKRGKR